MLVRAQSEHHAVTYHFPDAYSGSNTKIRGVSISLSRYANILRLATTHCRNSSCVADQLNNLILKSPQNWQTSVALPFFQIEGTVVEWDE